MKEKTNLDLMGSSGVRGQMGLTFLPQPHGCSFWRSNAKAQERCGALLLGQERAMRCFRWTRGWSSAIRWGWALRESKREKNQSDSAPTPSSSATAEGGPCRQSLMKVSDEQGPPPFLHKRSGGPLTLKSKLFLMAQGYGQARRMAAAAGPRPLDGQPVCSVFQVHLYHFWA